MTQEQIVRRMLQGFVDDPPDSEHQEGFLGALVMIAGEVMGFEWDDELLTKARDLLDDQTIVNGVAVAAKAKPALTVIDGGKPVS